MTTIAEQKRLVKATCQKYKTIPWIPLARKQKETSYDPPARGGVWISRATFSAPSSTSLRDALYRVIGLLKTDYHQITRDVPLSDVGVEFIGARPGVANDAPEPDILEDEKLKLLEKDCRSDMTILYVHGGGL